MSRCVCLAFAVLLTLGIGSQAASAGEIAIQVSPSTINLAYQGTRVTVHADIPYGAVLPDSVVTLNGIAATSTFADDCGDLVAKFDVDAVKRIIAPPSADLTLEGIDRTGERFSGTDTVRVIDRKSKR